MVGIPGGRQLALSDGGGSFLASSARLILSWASACGVNTGASSCDREVGRAGSPCGVAEKSRTQMPAQSGNFPSAAYAASRCAGVGAVLSVGGGVCAKLMDQEIGIRNTRPARASKTAEEPFIDRHPRKKSDWCAEHTKLQRRRYQSINISSGRAPKCGI